MRSTLRQQHIWWARNRQRTVQDGEVQSSALILVILVQQPQPPHQRYNLLAGRRIAALSATTWLLQFELTFPDV